MYIWYIYIYIYILLSYYIRDINKLSCTGQAFLCLTSVVQETAAPLQPLVLRWCLGPNIQPPCCQLIHHLGPSKVNVMSHVWWLGKICSNREYLEGKVNTPNAKSSKSLPPFTTGQHWIAAMCVSKCVKHWLPCWCMTPMRLACSRIGHQDVGVKAHVLWRGTCRMGEAQNHSKVVSFMKTVQWSSLLQHPDPLRESWDNKH